MKTSTIKKQQILKRFYHRIFSNIYFKAVVAAALIVGVSLTIYFAVSTSVPLRVVTGPIIGKVTTTTARVLLEFSIETLMTVILTDPLGNQIKSVKNTKAFIPVAFAFEGLHPGTTYTVSLSDSSLTIVDSYFTTLTGESGKLDFAVASCHDRTVQAKTSLDEDLWADLLAKVQNNEIQYLFHIGDQIYMDGATGHPSPFDDCMALIDKTPPSEWDTVKPLILDIIRNEYRLTWSNPSVKETLAKVPSLMIFDDHEVRDNYAFIEPDADPTTAYYFYGSLTRQVYYEYERQLREDINFDDLSLYTSEYFFEVLNDMGFFFMEYRGVRTWDLAYSQMGESFIGQTQKEFLLNILDSNREEYANISNFFLLSTLAIVEPSQEGYPGQNVTNDESWGYTAAHNNERGELLDTLREWKTVKEGREMTILAGDTHLGSYTDIMYDGEIIFLQIVASCISSSVYNEKHMAEIAITFETQSLVDNWSFQHQSLTNKHNYGIVLASTQGGIASADCYLVSI